MPVQYATPVVPAQWAESRNTHAAVAMAIHALADVTRTADAIWLDPTPAEWDHVKMAVQGYTCAGVVPPEDDHRYAWGDAVIDLRP